MAWTFNYVDIATYSLMRTFKYGQLTVSHGTRETGDIHGCQSGGPRPGDHVLVTMHSLPFVELRKWL